MNTKIIAFLSMLALVTNSLGQQASSNTTQSNYSPNFTGTNTQKLLAQLKLANKRTGKQGEFETREEYQERVNKSVEKVSNSGSLTFVFTPKQVGFSYSPDTGILTLLIERKEHDRDGDSRPIEIAYNKKLIGTYSASNPFGAKATIKRIKSQSLVLQYDNDLLRLGGELDGVVAPNKVTSSVSPKIAKELKNNIAIAYIGKLKAPFHDVFEREWGAPTLSDPYEWVSETESIHIDLSQVTIFNFKTGKIYKSLMVPELISEGKEQKQEYDKCVDANGYFLHRDRCGDSDAGNIGIKLTILEL